MVATTSSPITQLSGDSSPITQVSPAPAPSQSQYYIPGRHAYPSKLVLDLRGTRFDLDRDTLISLPESILIVMFPNGLILRPQASTAGAGAKARASAATNTANTNTRGSAAAEGGSASAGGGTGGGTGVASGHGHHPSESTYTDYSDYSDYSYEDYDEDEDDYRDDDRYDDDQSNDDDIDDDMEEQVIQLDFDPVCLQYILAFYRQAQRLSEAQRRMRFQEQQMLLQRQRMQQQQQLRLQLGGSNAGGAAGSATAGAPLSPSEFSAAVQRPLSLGSIVPQNPLTNKQAIIVLREELDYFAIPPSSKGSSDAKAKDTLITTSASLASSSSGATAAATVLSSVPPTAGSKEHQQQSARPRPPPPALLIKTQCGRILLEDRKVFTALQRNVEKENNQAEQHLMDMLCVSGFQRDGEWGYRRLEPKRTTVVSVAMVLLRTSAVPASHTPSTPASSSTSTATSTSASTKAANGSAAVASTVSPSEVADSGTATSMTTAGPLDMSDATIPTTTPTTPGATTTAASATRDKEGSQLPKTNGAGAQNSTPGTGPTIQEQNQIQMAIAQKLLLFWRKPARKCWWDGIQVEIDQPGDDATSVKVPVRLWARRTWTLELVLV